MLLSQMQPRRDPREGIADRAVFVGESGCGKTTLAHALLAQCEYVVALDPNGVLDWPEYRMAETLSDLQRIGGGKRAAERNPRIIYRPDPLKVSDPGEDWDTVLRWVHRRGNTTLYVDEAYAIAEHGITPGLTACVTRGRAKGVAVWAACQRPARIPLFLLSEAGHWYVFQGGMPEDRRRVEELAHIPQRRMARLPEYSYIYARRTGPLSERGTWGPLRLQLTPGGGDSEV